MRNKLVEVYGWYGTVAIIGAYALSSFDVITSDNLIYQFLNLTGAIGIVLVSLTKKVYQPAALNSIWTIIAIFAIFKILL
jgi:hypothetical protein